MLELAPSSGGKTEELCSVPHTANNLQIKLGMSPPGLGCFTFAHQSLRRAGEPRN